MVFSIDLYVSLKIVLKYLTLFFTLQSFNKPLEHLRNGIFSSEKELGGYIRSRFFNSLESVQNEFPSLARNLRILKLFENISSLLDIVYKIPYWLCVCTDFLHSFYVKFKMRDMAFPERMDISFLSNNDLVYKACCISISDGNPDFLDTCKFSLELFA